MGKSSTTTDQSGTSNTTPWEPQQGYLTDVFQKAQNLYNKSKNGAYKGDYVAAPTSAQYGANDTAGAFGTNQGYNGANTLLNSGSTLLGAGGANSGAAASSLTNGANQTAGGLSDQARTIANGYDVGAATDAATFGAYRNAAESTVPNLYRSAASSGNLNSDRTALAQGVVDRGLAENYQNTYATLANQNYQNSLGTAQSMNNGNTSAATALGSLGQGQTQQGSTNTANGVTTGAAAANLATGAANANTALDQSKLDNGIAKVNNTNNYNWTQLQNYLKSVTGSYGGTTTSSSTGTTTKDPGLAATLGGGLGLIGSLI